MLWSEPAISSLLSTGLSLRQIGEIIHDNPPHDKIEERLQEPHLRRYKIWYGFSKGTKAGKIKEPLIILIAGVPGTGKTTTAGEIAARLGIKTIICGDWMREAARPLVSEEKYPIFFSSVYDCWKLFGDSPTEESITKGYRAQAALINESLKKIIARGINKGENAIIEYLHFMPIEELKKKNVITIVLCIKDKAEHEKWIKSREKDTHFMEPANRLIEQLDKYRIIQELIISEAEKNNIPIIDTPRENDVIGRVLDIVLDRVNKLQGL